MSELPDESKAYELPTHTLPGLNITDHLADIEELKDFCEKRGIQTKNTRIDRYCKYLNEVAKEGVKDDSQVFPNWENGPFLAGVDRCLYVLREIHELAWIARGLQKRMPSGINDKLKIIVSGSDFAIQDSNTQSRNVQFELRIASYFCQLGYEVNLETTTDIIAFVEDIAFFVECKRVASKMQIQRRLTEAVKQLRLKMPSFYGKRVAYGCIALDVTKVAFPHNGLTWAQTPEHSKDVIQAKLIKIGDGIFTEPIFRSFPNLLQFWLQIHIPSLVLHPPMTTTRFSSYFLQRERISRSALQALNVFRNVFEQASLPDPRTTPPKLLKGRIFLQIPAGANCLFPDDTLVDYFKTGQLSEMHSEKVIAELTINGQKHPFFFSDLKMLVASDPNTRQELETSEPIQAAIGMVVKMFAQRYPYEDFGPETGKASD